MKKIVNRVLAFGTSFALVMATGFTNSSLYGVLAKASVIENNEMLNADVETCDLAGEEEKTKDMQNSDSKDEKDYIVITSGEKGYQRVEDFAEEEKILDKTSTEEQDVLEENHMLLLSLDKEEKAEVEDIKGVEVLERDWKMTANEEVPFDEELVEEVIENNEKIEFNQWNLDAINLPYNDAPTGTTTSIGEEISVSTGAAFEKENIDTGKKYTGKGIKVAILDSGVSYTENISITQRINFGEENESSNAMFNDPSGHGTGIAGIISADEKEGNLRGIATNAEIYSVQILDMNNETTISQVIQGIYWCIENKMDVINMSFGTSHYSSALEEAIQSAKDAGIVMVAAAGNMGEEAEGIEYPAAFSEVIAVGASDGSNAMADFTSRGEGIDILAPGEKVWTQSVFQGNMAIDGTSIAAAHVTGAVALLLEKYPDADGEFLRQLLQTSSSLATNQENIGVLNVAEALERGNDFEVSKEMKCMPQERVQVEYDTDEIVTGCWGVGVHEDIVYSYEDTSRTTVAVNNIIAAANAAYLADKMFPTSDGYGVIHGQHNYVANLHYLYEAAHQFLTTSNSIGKCADYAAQNSVHAKDYHYGTEDYDKMKEVLTNLWDGNEMNYYGKNEMIYTEVNSRDEKGWAVVGIGAHLLGDVFAHRGLVPKSKIISDTRYFSNEKQTELNQQIVKGVIEFRDFKHYRKDGVDKAKVNKEYEDNVEFCSNRYNAAINATYQWIEDMKLVKGFDISRILNASGLNTNIKLNNLTNYTNSAGYAGSAVSKYSSGGYMANYIDNYYTEADGDVLDYSYGASC